MYKLNIALEELEYTLKTRDTKSIEVREHYIKTAIRYIEESKKEIYNDLKFREDQVIGLTREIKELKHENKSIMEIYCDI